MKSNQWSQFSECSSKMLEPVVFPDAIKEDLKEFRRLYKELICGMLKDRRRRNHRFKVWLNGYYKEDNVEKIYDNPPEENESIDDWAERLFKGQKFGMITNDGELHSLNLNRKLSIYLKPVLEEFGMPLESLSIVSFMGNYGFTPLGVHIDQTPIEMTERNIFHFHLGPGSKTMYTWEKDVYQELAGGQQNYKKPEKILSYANKYLINPGDIFFLPWEKFHIGDTPEFSIGIGVIYSRDSNLSLAEKIFDVIKAKTLNLENKKVVPTYFPENKQNSSTINTFNEILNFDDEALSFREFFNKEMEDYKLEVLSNAGFGINTKLIKEDFEFSNDDIIKGTEPFQLYYKIEGDNESIILYARGQKLNIPYQNSLLGLIEAVNSWRKYTVGSLIEPLLDEWEEEIGFYIINFLYTSGAVELLSNNK